jgi:hypothetical protein
LTQLKPSQIGLVLWQPLPRCNPANCLTSSGD